MSLGLGVDPKVSLGLGRDLKGNPDPGRETKEDPVHGRSLKKEPSHGSAEKEKKDFLSLGAKKKKGLLVRSIQRQKPGPDLNQEDLNPGRRPVKSPGIRVKKDLAEAVSGTKKVQAVIKDEVEIKPLSGSP